MEQALVVEMQNRVGAVNLALTRIFDCGSVAQIGDNSVAFTYFCRGKERDVNQHIRLVERYPEVARCLLMNFFHCPIVSEYRM